MLRNVCISIFVTFLFALSVLGTDSSGSSGNKGFTIQLRVLEGSTKDLSEEESLNLSYEGIFQAFELSETDFYLIFAGKPITNKKSFESIFVPMGIEKIFLVPYKKIEVLDLKNPKKSYALKLISSTLASLKVSLLELNLDKYTDDCPLYYGEDLLINNNQVMEALRLNQEKRIYIDFSSSLRALERQKRQYALDKGREDLNSAVWDGLSSDSGDLPDIKATTLVEVCPGAPRDFWDHQLGSDEKTAKNEIFPNFFIGDDLATFMALYGREAGQFTIFNFNSLDVVPESAKMQVEAKGINYYQITVRDRADGFENLLAVFQENDLQLKITEALLSGKKVLIACQMGKSRSVTIAILYLMYEFKLNAIQAYRVIKNSRPCVEPNLGFLVGLLAIEKEQAGIDPYIPQEIGEAWLGSLSESEQGQKSLEIIDTFLANPDLACKNDDHQPTHIFKPSKAMRHQEKAYYWDIVSLLRLKGVNFSAELVTERRQPEVVSRIAQGGDLPKDLPKDFSLDDALKKFSLRITILENSSIVMNPRS